MRVVIVNKLSGWDVAQLLEPVYYVRSWVQGMERWLSG